MLCAALPALADTRFQARRMTRDAVRPGRGQCDIRLRVNQEVEVSLRGDTVDIRTISGSDPSDDGSECSAPLPSRDIAGFTFQIIDKRDQTRLLAEPSSRNGFAAVVTIRNAANIRAADNRNTPGGEERYHFRLTWMLGAGNSDRLSPRRDETSDRPSGAPGFSWNNTVSFRGKGRGAASVNDAGEMVLGEVNIEIDRGGKVVAWFRAGGRGRPLSFTGQILASEGSRWKADVMSEDRRLRGPMWITVDNRRQVENVTLEATDGRDHMRLSWDRH